MANKIKTVGLTLAAVSALACTAIFAPASGHGWYPKECCHDVDCAPVDDIAWLVPAGGAAPQIIVTTRHGKAILRSNVSARESKDSRMHVCMRRFDTGDMEVICLFLPPGM
jgi:hypothetical protein